MRGFGDGGGERYAESDNADSAEEKDLAKNTVGDVGSRVAFEIREIKNYLQTHKSREKGS